MEKAVPARDPDAYVRALRGWRRSLVELLREAVCDGDEFEEAIKWGHLVYLRNGPAILIRAEAERVLFGFWRGKRLVRVDPLLKPGGKYEMANREFRKGDTIASELARELAKRAASLNDKLGDPTKAVGS